MRGAEIAEIKKPEAPDTPAELTEHVPPEMQTGGVEAERLAKRKHDNEDKAAEQADTKRTKRFTHMAEMRQWCHQYEHGPHNAELDALHYKLLIWCED
jgi:hypothetical protein